MPLLLFVEEVGFGCVDCDFDTSDIKDAVVQKFVELGHLMQQEKFVDMDRVTRNHQLLRLNPYAHQKIQDILFCLLEGESAGEARVSEP